MDKILLNIVKSFYFTKIKEGKIMENIVKGSMNTS